MSLIEHQRDVEPSAPILSSSVKSAPFLAFWRAKVTEHDRAFFQPTCDDDEVFMLQLEKTASLKKLYGKCEATANSASAEETRKSSDDGDQ